MAPSDLVFMAVSELAVAIRRRDVSPVEITESFLDRIRHLNDRFKAFITVSEQRARAEAIAAEKELSAGTDLGALHGIPYACKDIIHTRGAPTTAGSRVPVEKNIEEDANVIERLAGNGAVLLGKTNLHEFAYGATGENPHFGTVPNPYGAQRLAGGSSSGSAAAVACGLAPAALATDTGGSTRVPATLCGLVGLKPTQGRISVRGVIPYCWSFDHVGVITRTARDAALFLGAMAGHDPMDPASADVPIGDYGGALDGDIRGLRIGVPRQFFLDHADGEIVGATHRIIELLQRLGAEPKAIDVPSMEHVRTVSIVIQMPEALSYHGRHLPERAALYGDDMLSGLAVGQFLLAEHYVRAKRMVEVYRRETTAMLDGVDAMITPACPIVAPEIGTTTVTTDGLEEPVGNALTRYTTLFNMTGEPALTVPSGMHSSGLPMGVQIVGRLFDEATILRVGHAIQENDGCPIPRPNLDGLGG
jgi:aspartyl-tRNA(Asn)/glutamyl-tRNA(Gln) amidotransferase subunit A